MSTVDLSRFSFSGGENAAPVEDLGRLPREDRQRLVLAGIDVEDRRVSGAFMQLNHAGVHCETRRDGLELMDIRAALKKYDGLPGYYWRLLDPDKDDFTRMARDRLNGGYFVRVRKGVTLSEPVQSCMFIKGRGAGQSIHNIVIVEEDAELHILGGCATAARSPRLRAPGHYRILCGKRRQADLHHDPQLGRDHNRASALGRARGNRRRVSKQLHPAQSRG